jgi:prephenate dehydratase
MTTIGYLGPEGTFTQSALLHYLAQKPEKHTLISAKNSYNLFQHFAKNECDEIIFPIENSIEGFVSSNLDLLTECKTGYLSAEITLTITQHLLGKVGTTLSKITHILSHPHAIAQCQKFIQTSAPHAQLVTTPSTAAAAEWICSPETRPSELKDALCAAIGNERLSELYPLEILQKEINDYPNNQTRFLVLSHTPSLPTGNDKTSLVFSAEPNVPGSLYTVIGEFAKRGINLTHISSRPEKSVLGEYLFFIDFEGHQNDKIVIDVLKALTPVTRRVTVLGSYRKG